MTKRFARSWQLLKYSASVLNENRLLLVFPFCSAIAALAVVASFLPALIAIPEANDDYYTLAVVGAIYLLEYFVMIFFNTALVGAVSIHMQGGKPTLADGFRLAGSHLAAILGYALIAATVGVILRVISERVGFVGQIVVWFIGVGWTAATYLTVPVLVNRNVGPVAAIKHSSVLLKKTWGENLIASGGLGLIFSFIYVGIIFLTIAATYGVAGSSNTLPFVVISVGVVLGVLAALVQTALAGVFSAALYNYANGGEQGDGGGAVAAALPGRANEGSSEVRMGELFANAFHPK
jgi:hypothetical protein